MAPSTREAVCRGSIMPPLDGGPTATYAFPMRDEPQNGTTPPGRGGTGFVAWVAWPLLFLLVVYPLSVEPVVTILGPNPPTVVRFIYAPLAYLVHHSQPVRSFYDWYFRVWGVS